MTRNKDMSIIANQNPITIRRMEYNPADLQQYLNWMRDPEVMRFWDGMTVQYTYAKVAEQHRKHIAEGVTPCFILLNSQPIGYCQFHRILQSAKSGILTGKRHGLGGNIRSEEDTP